MRRKVGFYHVGNAWVGISVFLKAIGCEPVIPPFNSQKTLDIGAALAPEGICVPYKFILGNVKDCLDMGAEVIMMLSACGISGCRLAYFGKSQKLILNKLGYKYDMVEFTSPRIKDILDSMYRLNPEASLSEILKAASLAIRVFAVLDELEDFYLYNRATVRDKNAFDRAYSRAAESLLDIGGISYVFDARKKAFDILEKGMENCHCTPSPDNKSGIELPGRNKTSGKTSGNIAVESLSGTAKKSEEPVRRDLDREHSDNIKGSDNDSDKIYLGRLYKNVSFGTIITNVLHLGPSGEKSEKYRQSLASEYLPRNIGGLARNTVGDVVYSSLSGRDIDAVVHLYPFQCTPESAASNIIERISKDLNVPTLSLCLDE
ncbi:MAG: hypothetical protein QW728_00090, partial [Thermoplasmata archaeon]